jgi:hypothetical protein
VPTGYSFPGEPRLCGERVGDLQPSVDVVDDVMRPGGGAMRAMRMRESLLGGWWI